MKRMDRTTPGPTVSCWLVVCFALVGAVLPPEPGLASGGDGPASSASTALSEALAASHEVLEPDGYRMDNYREPVPRTLKGARVMDTVAAEAIYAAKEAIFIDVYPRAPKPPNLPKGTLWRDPPHTTIKGAYWLANVGYGALPPEDVRYFKEHLAAYTGGDRAKPLVFFCERDCWMSWNAAKRALEYGYETVIWYPDGIDGWLEAGNDFMNAKPEPQVE